jgi:hypothetical protein
MEALTAIFSILYAFWPLLILSGMRVLFLKKGSLKEKMLLAARRVFLVWFIWAIFLGFIYWQGRQPILIWDGLFNYLSFSLLGMIMGGITLGDLIYR